MRPLNVCISDDQQNVWQTVRTRVSQISRFYLFIYFFCRILCDSHWEYCRKVCTSSKRSVESFGTEQAFNVDAAIGVYKSSKKK